MIIDKKTKLILEKRNKEVRATLELRQELEVELYSEKTDDVYLDEKQTLGLTSNQLIESTEKSLLVSEQLGLFDSISLTNKDVFPTLLARIPIFMPVTRSKQKELLDDDNYLHFETPFGSGTRSGPLLNIRDEDTMLALDRLRSKQLHGIGSNLPIHVPDQMYNMDESGKTRVDIVICTVTQINEELGLTDGGDNHTETLNSVRRLGNTVIELTTNKTERYLGRCKEGGQFKLLDVRWKEYDDNGILFIQFSPVVTEWLTHEFTYINWQVRKGLGRNDTAKALHRFLSSQPNSYSRNMNEVANLIGVRDEKRRIKTKLTNAAELLKKVGWLKDYAFIGTGRKVPYQLVTQR